MERYFFSRFFKVVILKYEVFIEYPPEGDIRILWPASSYHQLLTGVSPDKKIPYKFFREANLPSVSTPTGGIMYLADSAQIIEWAKEDSKINSVPYKNIVKTVENIDNKKNEAFEKYKRDHPSSET